MAFTYRTARPSSLGGGCDLSLAVVPHGGWGAGRRQETDAESHVSKTRCFPPLPRGPYGGGSANATAATCDRTAVAS
ncbi:hypothetical protein BHE74_00028312 [Ensete ventricosum]|nr:hypothetical protein GW17_00003631 [Ensete ventricosum]RWW64452.1 hypothetical protein BHE74_00028312 [Ensete ventricosum]